MIFWKSTNKINYTLSADLHLLSVELLDFLKIENKPLAKATKVVTFKSMKNSRIEK